MLWLLLGLIAFIGMHSAAIFAPEWRNGIIENKGKKSWDGLYTIVSLIGFGLIIWGYGQTRVDATFIWNPPRGLLHINVLLSLIAFIFLAAVYVPNNHLKKAVGHPMIIGVKLWAFGHLIANGRLGDIVLFGCFLVWAIVYFAVNRRRDRASGLQNTLTASTGSTVITVVVGTIAWAVFAFLLHGYLIGVNPFSGAG